MPANSRSAANKDLNFTQWKFFLYRETHFTRTLKMTTQERTLLIFFILIENFLINENKKLTVIDILKALEIFGLPPLTIAACQNTDMKNIKRLQVLHSSTCGYWLKSDFVAELVNELEKKTKHAIAFAQTLKKAVGLYPDSSLGQQLSQHSIFDSIDDGITISNNCPSHSNSLSEQNEHVPSELDSTIVEEALGMADHLLQTIDPEIEPNNNNYNPQETNFLTLRHLSSILNKDHHAKDDEVINLKEWQIFQNQNKLFFSSSLLHALSGIFLENAYLRHNRPLASQFIIDGLQLLSQEMLTNPRSLPSNSTIAYLQSKDIVQSKKGSGNGYFLNDNLLEALTSLKENSLENYVVLLKVIETIITIHPDHPLSTFFSNELSPQEQFSLTPNSQPAIPNVPKRKRKPANIQLDFHDWKPMERTPESTLQGIWSVLLINYILHENKSINSETMYAGIRALNTQNLHTSNSGRDKNGITPLKQYSLLQSSYRGYCLTQDFLDNLLKIKNFSDDFNILFITLRNLLKLYAKTTVAKNLSAALEAKLQSAQELSEISPATSDQPSIAGSQDNSPEALNLLDEGLISLPDFNLDVVFPVEEAVNNREMAYCSSRLFALPPSKRQITSWPINAIDLTTVQTPSTTIQTEKIDFSTWQSYLHRAELYGYMEEYVFLIFCENHYLYGNPSLSFYNITHGCLALSDGKLDLQRVYNFLEKLVAANILKMDLTIKDAFYTLDPTSYHQNIKNFPGENFPFDFTFLYHLFMRWTSKEVEEQVTFRSGL